MALALCGLAGVAAQEDELFIDILPEDGDSPETASAIYGRLQAALAGTNRRVDDFASLDGLLSTGTSMSQEVDTDAAGVDIYSETGVKATAGSNFELTAGGGLEAKIQDKAQLTLGALDVQALASVSLLSGDDAEISVDGDIGTVATGSVSLDAASLSAAVGGSARLTAGGVLDLKARGSASLEADSLLAQVRGDIDAAGAALKLSGTKGLSVVAGSVDVQTPGAVRIAGKGGVAELGGEGSTEFVGFIWTGPSTFDTYTTTVPEVVSDVTEVVIRASYAGNAAEVVADAPTTLTMEIGEADANGAVTYTKVWASAVGVGTFSLDGLVISLDRGYAVKSIKLSAGDSVYSGWSQVVFNLGVTTVGGLKLASASSLEATAARGVLLGAESVTVNAATDLDVSAAISASILSKDVSVLASASMAASAASLDVQVSDTIEAFSGGEATASVGSLTAESRGAATLTAAGAVGLSAEEANVAVSGDLEATAAKMKLNTDSLETMTAALSATVAQAASLYTTDASLSASGTLSAYMGGGEIISEGTVSMQSSGDVGMRTQGSVLLESMESTTLRTGSLTTTTGAMKVHAGGGHDSTTAKVEVVCNGDCSETQFRQEMADLLGVPLSRLRVEATEVDGTGRRRMQEGDEQAVGRKRSGRAALDLWSVAELQKYVGQVLGLPKLAAEIQVLNIDGAMAVEMSKGEWKEMGATGLEGARIVSALKKFSRGAGEARSR